MYHASRFGSVSQAKSEFFCDFHTEVNIIQSHNNITYIFNLSCVFAVTRGVCGVECVRACLAFSSPTEPNLARVASGHISLENIY